MTDFCYAGETIRVKYERFWIRAICFYRMPAGERCPRLYECGKSELPYETALPAPLKHGPALEYWAAGRKPEGVGRKGGEGEGGDGRNRRVGMPRIPSSGSVETAPESS